MDRPTTSPRNFAILAVLVLLAGCSGTRQIHRISDHDPNNAIAVLRVGTELRTHDFSTAIDIDGSTLDVLWRRYEPIAPKARFSARTDQARRFVAYSLPPGRYRIAEAILFVRDIPVTTGFDPRSGAQQTTTFQHKVRLAHEQENQIVFEVRPGEIVYVGDIVYQFRVGHDVYRIAVEDRFSAAKRFFKRKFSDSHVALTRQLARYSRFDAR